MEIKLTDEQRVRLYCWLVDRYGLQEAIRIYVHLLIVKEDEDLPQNQMCVRYPRKHHCIR